MAVAGRSGEQAAASSLADALREAAFVRLLAAPDGDALAATGLFARALTERATPFQASVVRTERPTNESVDDTADETDTTTVRVGHDGPAALTLTDRPASETAFEACRELGTEPDPVLALAGTFAASDIEGSAAFDVARERGHIEQRPGISAPVEDVADGLAHTTLAHAPFSGDREAAAAALDSRRFGTGDDGHRRVASLLVLSVLGMEHSTPRAATAIERALEPYAIVDGERAGPQFGTVGGYADVLCASAHEQPGVGLALALGHDAREAALSAWRTHAKRAHAALGSERTERHRNLFVVHVTAGTPLSTTARLLCEFRSPEPVALVCTESAAAVAAAEDADIGRRTGAAATTAGGTGDGSARRGRARFEDSEEFVAALREALA